MEFNRGSQAGPTRPTSTAAPSAAAPQKPSEKRDFSSLTSRGGKLHRWSFIALLVSATALFIATIFFIVFGTPVNRESRFVDNDKYQAVFVNVNGTNGGQVYFGKISSLTPQYIRLSKVFYIQNQAGENQQNASYNLVKLGCELHGPTDEMIINRDEVFFWENLKTDGQVTQKINEWAKQNPSGEQKCNSNSGSTDQSSGTTQQPANGSQGTTTPTPTPTPTTTPTTTPSTTKKP